MDTQLIGTDTAPRLRYHDIGVEYGVTKALAGITASIHAGEIVGLLGHNGAGKSTLFNVTSGAAKPTRGTISINGAAREHGLSPAEAARLGVTIIHQEPALVPNLSIFDNLVLARTSGRDLQSRRAEAADTLAKVGLDMDLDTMVAALDIGQRQLVELARGLLGTSISVLLLDEPTAALGKSETDALHALIRKFANDGAAVVYVSHRLPDILDVCTRILILRGGELVLDGPATEFTPPRLAEALVPGLADASFESIEAGDVALRTLDRPPVHVRSGEVVGLFGMAAGEQFGLLEEIVGMGKTRADIELHGTRMVLAGPADSIAHGVTLVPADRERDGLVPGLSGMDNLMLPWFSRLPGKGWWVTPSTGADIYARARRKLEIHGPGPSAEIAQFSGGNRQKHMLARWLYPRRPEVLLLAQPTQGVDVGAKRDIVRAVRAAAADGAAVVVASAESDEISTLCDRAYVLYEGATVEVPRTGSFDEHLMSALLGLAADLKNSMAAGSTFHESDPNEY